MSEIAKDQSFPRDPDRTDVGVIGGTWTNTVSGVIWDYVGQYVIEADKLMSVGYVWERRVSSVSEQVQTDYLQNDTAAKDYIKNRPFYTGDPVDTVLVEESTVDFAVQDGMYTALWPDSSANFEAVEGKTYKVYFDGVLYICVAKLFSSLLIIGNTGLLGVGEDTGEPFIIINQSGSTWNIATTDTSPSHVLSIRTIDNEIKQIDSKYLPMASDSEYGVVKKSEIITSYVFSNDVKVSQMKKAIDDFNNGSARIKWKEDIVISARYEDDTLYVVFSTQPYRTMSMTSSDFYGKDLLMPVSSGDGFMKRLYINSRDSESAYGIIGCYGLNSEQTIELFADHLDLAYGDIRARGKAFLNRKELILQSSTDSSTKRFKITVDDSGTISATEVTS